MLSGVSKTAILTLRARADEHRATDRLFADPTAVEWYAQAEWPHELDHWYTPWSQTKTAFRVDQIDALLRARLRQLPEATVVELGCGLSSRYQRIGAELGPRGRWVDLDLLEVIALRTSLGIRGEDHRHLACSVLDHEWLTALEVRDPANLVLIAEGLFYYLPRSEVDRLFREMRRHFKGATIVFDVIGSLDFKASVASSERAGAPILWMVDPPFEAAMLAFGVEVLAGFEPEVLLEQLIDRFARRYGRPMRLLLSSLARFRTLRARRSGVMMGRLMPILV